MKKKNIYESEKIQGQKFNRSEFVKNRWGEAERQQKFYNFLDPDNDFTKRDFFKNESPLSQRLKVFEVSYQLSYLDRDNNGIQSNLKTFKFYTLEYNPETESSIYQKVKDSVINMRGVTSGDAWSRESKAKLLEPYTNVEVKTLDPQGIEESHKNKVSREILDKTISGNGYYTEEYDNILKVEKIKYGKPTGEKFDQRLQADLTHFI